MSEFAILKVEAGVKRCFARGSFQTVTVTVAGSSRANVPCTPLSAKHFSSSGASRKLRADKEQSGTIRARKVSSLAFIGDPEYEMRTFIPHPASRNAHPALATRRCRGDT